MSYLDMGFDQFLNRAPLPPIFNTQGDEIDPLAFDSFTQQISATKIQGGAMSSPDGKVKLDLDQGVFAVSNGVQNLVTLGVLPDGSVGLLIQDNNGNILLQVAGSTNILNSANGHMVLDFTKETFTINDDALIPVVLLGKLTA